jgi:hypothetical protein
MTGGADSLHLITPPVLGRPRGGKASPSQIFSFESTPAVAGLGRILREFPLVIFRRSLCRKYGDEQADG